VLRYFQPVVYVQLEPDKLSLREVGSGKTVSEAPLAAISREPKKRLLGVGDEAQGADGEIVNPFKHPRSLVSDFTVAEVILKAFMKKLFAGRLFVPRPVVVLHPRVNPLGGFTQIEIRALRELAVGAGAAKVFVWRGRDLTDEELLSLRFPPDGEVLN
jgi:rod shape-determining protein MreB